MITFSNYSYRLEGQKQKPTNVAIGHFDGVHLGHQKLLKTLADPAAVVSFYPRPEVVLKKISSARYLFSREQKVRAFKELGIASFFRDQI